MQASIKNLLQDKLNQHGYAFHYRVLEEAKRLFEENTSPWLFEAAEFPVEIKNKDTRIDLILAYGRHRSTAASITTYIIGECKRTNPSMNQWCFVKAPFVRRDSMCEKMILERALKKQGQFTSTGWSPGFRLDETYHIGLVLKSKSKGDKNTPDGGGRDGIEASVTQVLRGCSGFVEYNNALAENLVDGWGAILIPVVFTTAKLFTSDVDLSKADLEQGTVELDDEPTEVPYLFYQYNSSAGIRNTIMTSYDPVELGKVLESEYMRTVCVVNARGIERFLKNIEHELS